MSDDPINPPLHQPCPLPRGTIRRGGGFCATCAEVVHDLSTVSRAEARALLGRSDVRCVRFEQDPRGAVLHDLRVAAVVVTTLLAACDSPEKPLETGVLVVQVSDDRGRPIPLASVAVEGLEGQLETNENGEVRYYWLQPGIHKLAVGGPYEVHKTVDIAPGTTTLVSVSTPPPERPSYDPVGVLRRADD